uniref:Uncharacterized protein n=1 Tax=Anguilla anguilla TaxID=7936 RepID=A0A0E9QVH1_ANGAN
MFVTDLGSYTIGQQVRSSHILGFDLVLLIFDPVYPLWLELL